MADFCNQCSKDTFGHSYGDLADLTDPIDWQNGKAVVVICEGCGGIQVDPLGNCVSKDCICRGKEGHGLPWIEQPTNQEP